MAVNLPIELLRSFVAIVETGSMLQATERVFVTQSALSLQMRRLEDLTRQPLFNRHGRKLSLTGAGQQMLRTARQILELNDQVLAVLQSAALSGTVRLGMNQDFAELFLAGVLGYITKAHPQLQMQVRVAASQELLGQLAAGQLDNVLCVRPEEDAGVVRRAAMSWYGDSQLLAREVLPLALLEPPCMFRAAALQQLEAAGIPHRVVLETGSLSAIRAAVQGGLAVTCRSPLFAETAPVTPLSIPGLGHLPQCGYAVFASSVATPAIAALDALLRQNIENLN